MFNDINNFIGKAREIHSDRYDYTLCRYGNKKTKVIIKCNVHGEFEQLKGTHLQGKGCPRCAGKGRSIEDILKIFKEKHGDKYSYPNLNTTRVIDKISIICPEHGEFRQQIREHIKGKGCPKCAINFRKDIISLTKDEFINRAKEVHGDKYDYSNINYVNLKTPIKLTCLTHGEFEQRPDVHIKSEGCSKCTIIKTIIESRLTLDEFKERARLNHIIKYDYSLVNYQGMGINVIIICPEHGKFEQRPDVHLKGGDCIKCFNSGISKKEIELQNFLTELKIESLKKSRKILKGLELDVYIPEHNLAIEFDGLYWHNEEFINNNYHLNKTQLCETQDIKLIHIFEDEWQYKQDIVKSRLKNILGLTLNKIYARKCIIKEVSSKDSNMFLTRNHIQGNVNSSIRLGLYYNNELVSLMTFSKGRIMMGGTPNQYELLRFCNKLDTTVIGGAGKLLKHFIKNYNPKEIISYADRRWSMGNLYKKLGFEFIHNSTPNYWYIIGNKRNHRFGFRKSILVKQGFDKNKSEHQIMLDRKIYRIYDCGNKKYQMIIS